MSRVCIIGERLFKLHSKNLVTPACRDVATCVLLALARPRGEHRHKDSYRTVRCIIKLGCTVVRRRKVDGELEVAIAVLPV